MPSSIGNVSWKMGVGNYAYHATRKRAVITAGSNSYGYDANGNMTSRNGSSIGYTSYHLPSSIAAGSSTSTLSYGAYRNRYKQVAVAGGITETTIYVAGLLACTRATEVILAMLTYPARGFPSSGPRIALPLSLSGCGSR